MKRLIAISLAFYLLLFTVGVNVYAHFCDNELQSASVITQQKGCCPGEVEAGITDDCCFDMQQNLKLDEYYTTSKSSNSSVLFVAFVQNVPSFLVFKSEQTVHNLRPFITNALAPEPDKVISFGNLRI